MSTELITEITTAIENYHQRLCRQNVITVTTSPFYITKEHSGALLVVQSTVSPSIIYVEMMPTGTTVEILALSAAVKIIPYKGSGSSIPTLTLGARQSSTIEYSQCASIITSVSNNTIYMSSTNLKASDPPVRIWDRFNKGNNISVDNTCQTAWGAASGATGSITATRLISNPNKIYFEIYYSGASGAAAPYWCAAGLSSSSAFTAASAFLGTKANTLGYTNTGSIKSNNVVLKTGTPYNSPSTLMFAVNYNSPTPGVLNVWIGKDGVWLNTVGDTPTATLAANTTYRIVASFYVSSTVPRFHMFRPEQSHSTYDPPEGYIEKW